MTYETVVHRFDATAAVGGRFILDEWVEFSTLPQAYESDSARHELLGPDRTLHIHATDSPEGTGSG